MPSSARRWSMLMRRPKHCEREESTLAMDREAGPALVHRHKLDRVDVEMRRKSRNPPNRLGDVARGHWLHARIERVRRRSVAAGADDGELGLGHARFDRGDAHPGAVQVAAEVERELVHESL